MKITRSEPYNQRQIMISQTDSALAMKKARKEALYNYGGPQN